MVTLHENRRADSGNLRESDYVYSLQGKTAPDPRRQGIRFAMKNNIFSANESQTGGRECFLALQFLTGLPLPQC